MIVFLLAVDSKCFVLETLVAFFAHSQCSIITLIVVFLHKKVFNFHRPRDDNNFSGMENISNFLMSMTCNLSYCLWIYNILYFCIYFKVV